jgi:pimeloyl-ACP methyl ester carboxylesterase
MKEIILSIIALLSLTLLICSSACCKDAGVIPDNTPVYQDEQIGTSKFPTDQYINAKGIKARYWTAGDKGPVVLLIHGFGASVEIWQHNIGSLAKSFRVYAIDLVGFGRSDKPEGPYNVSMITEFVDDFMKAAEIEKASLVGLSFGGGISLQYALQYPQKVEKLVLVDSVGLGTKMNCLVRLMSLPYVGECVLTNVKCDKIKSHPFLS